MLTGYLPETTVMTIKLVAVGLIVAAWVLIVWKQWWASAFVLVAPGAVFFIIAIFAFVGSILTLGQVDASKIINQMMKQLIKEAAVVAIALVMTIGVGVGWFVL